LPRTRVRIGLWLTRLLIPLRGLAGAGRTSAKAGVPAWALVAAHNTTHHRIAAFTHRFWSLLMTD
jgi:hypothetical protein